MGGQKDVDSWRSEARRRMLTLMSSPTARRPPAPEVEAEFRQAVADIERGDFLELTPEQVTAWADTGELPWPDESQDSARARATSEARR